MPNWSALRRRASEHHRRLRRYMAATADPLPTAQALLEAAEADTDVYSIALAPGDPLLAGAHAVLDRATPCIWYAQSNQISATWQNFARAHEFGHYWLHPELDVDACAVDDGPSGIATDTDRAAGIQTEIGYSPTERREKEADQFAAALLLPSRDVREAFLKHGWRASRIAAHVGVPDSCVYTQMASALLLPTPPDSDFQVEAGDASPDVEVELPPAPDPLPLLDASQR